MAEAEPVKVSRIQRALDTVERVGNKLPDPAVLFIFLLAIVWVCSWLFSYIDYEIIDPRSGQPLVVVNQLSGTSFVTFMTTMVNNFVTFPPVGMVLVAMLGIGVAEYSGFINAAIRAIMAKTSQRLLTPMVIVVGIVSHSAVDAGYVLVIPLGGLIFYAAGRHPLAGIAAAFAGVSGGFSANFVPSALDPLLQGLTQPAAQLLDPDIELNPLNNYFFTTASSVLIVSLGWYLTDRIVEPKLAGDKVDGDLSDLPKMEPLTDEERRGLKLGAWSMLIGLIVLFATIFPGGSPWRNPSGTVVAFNAPIMQSIVPLLFIFFVVPGLIYGRIAGTIRTSHQMIEGMTKAMQGMGHYLVIMFFIAQFVYAFNVSNLGVLMALKGAQGLQALALPAAITITGIVLLTGFLNLFVGSASGKWALIAPVFVPMLMQLGISPDLTQAAYRIGDSSTNIITPLMPYFPLVVVFAQRYVTKTGIGTVTAMMLPYSVTFIVAWTIFLMIYWAIGLPLGFLASYEYPAG
ncbi:MAG: AbgT family transporter [Woeseiaceae bacterium]|nr:AbgT family transporter [Woeseiaceae bacterium]